jgi:hypothetical protein
VLSHRPWREVLRIERALARLHRVAVGNGVAGRTFPVSHDFQRAGKLPLQPPRVGW